MRLLLHARLRIPPLPGTPSLRLRSTASLPEGCPMPHLAKGPPPCYGKTHISQERIWTVLHRIRLIEVSRGVGAPRRACRASWKETDGEARDTARTGHFLFLPSAVRPDSFPCFPAQPRGARACPCSGAAPPGAVRRRAASGSGEGCLPWAFWRSASCHSACATKLRKTGLQAFFRLCCPTGRAVCSAFRLRRRKGFPCPHMLPILR